MKTHTGRVFLNSCLKVPIDPCNNCPAPIYNRPKMYLGRFTTTPSINTTTKLTTPLTTTATTTTPAAYKFSEVETERTTCTQHASVRPLTKFYDSIPDYCDINHLPEEEFYSTLDTLRTTCRALKTKTNRTYSRIEESSRSTTSSSILPSNCHKLTRTKNKKKNNSSRCSKKNKDSQRRSDHYTLISTIGTPCSMDYGKVCINVERAKSFREDFQDEVEAFKSTLEEFERELKQRPRSAVMYKQHKCTNETSTTKHNKECTLKLNKEKVPERNRSYINEFRENLKKSYSLNDIRTSSSTPNDMKEKSQGKDTIKLDALNSKDKSKLSNYFTTSPKTKEEKKNDVPTILNESPSTESETLTSCGAKKKGKTKKSMEQLKLPFSIFNLSNSSSPKDNCENRLNASPIHPVARPNLAATLRVEVSKKKLKELQNTCTFENKSPQVDWEVRKTPAWKSLSFNESHKRILSIRLATRKAEQAQQKREYELHMELMRQRVKSAPLLLEGPTYWGPTVGKLTHNCPHEGTIHTCPSTQRKKSKSRTRNCSEMDCETLSGSGSRLSQKMNCLRKIYGAFGKSTKISCHSQTTNNGNRSRKTKIINKCDPITKEARNTTISIDSGDDDLSSTDRALL